MISPNAIAKISKKESIGFGIIEKDYFITLLLEGIVSVPALKQNLVFKGGTALRKIYFKDYRYSEDLDFTLKNAMKENELRELFEEAFAYLKKEHNADFLVKSFYSRKWFSDIKIQFVGLKVQKNTIAIDLMADETIEGTVTEKSVLNPYYKKAFFVPVYSLDEILAEKLRSFLQRTRVRDYFDAWFILTKAKSKIDKNKLKKIFLKKAEYKKLSFSGKKELFDSAKIEQARAYYQSQLGNQLNKLPPFDKLVEELRTAVNDLDL
ncbi:MAG: nucleotidyl transferase AbiEii/AbiGii toxin family protein [archaeon]|nr:nucleotidyl transferase AbiEii/AbiGii toxin family protein [archaeon]